MCTEDFRMIMKRGAGVPTVPASADLANGDWLDTDIYEGEFYQDTDTGVVYTRDASGIKTADGRTISMPFVLDQAAVNGMNASPYVLLSAPAGYAFRMLKKPVLGSSNGGSSWIFASGETITLMNTSLGAGIIAQWGDLFAYSDPYYEAGIDYFSYELVTGDIVVTSSIPITGGDASGTITFYIDYELFPIP